MAKKASTKAPGAKARRPARKSATASKPKSASPRPSKTRSKAAPVARAKPTPNKRANAAEALIELVESPLVADLLAAAVTAAAATILEHKLRKREKGSLVRAVGAATAAAVGRQLASELEEIRSVAREPKSGKSK